MTGIVLLWVLMALFPGMKTSVAISRVTSMVNATVHQTALLPVSFQPPSSSWDFVHFKWEWKAIDGSVPILSYLLDCCKGSEITQPWWDRECRIDKEVDDGYQKRVDIFRNGTLIIQDVELKDAGLYLVTIRAPDVKHETTVNLTVSGGGAITTGGLPSTVESRLKEEALSRAPTCLPAHPSVRPPLPHASTGAAATELALTKGMQLEKQEDPAALQKLSTENMVRMVLACLTLCLLGLMVMEHVYTVLWRQ